MNSIGAASVLRAISPARVLVLFDRVRSTRACSAVLILPGVLLPHGPAFAQQAGSIDEITPAAARHGEPVTIQGRGFGAQNVQITVAGLPAQVVAATGNQVTFRVPDAASPGLTAVTAANPGGHIGSIPFRVLEGVLLVGAPSAPAVSVTTEKPPVGVSPNFIQNGVFLTRLAVTFALNATVDQVNRALLQVQGGIVSMAPGLEFVTVGVPPQPNLAALQSLAATMRAAPGILLAFPGQASVADRLPVAPAAFQDTHLLPTRFPAAWNTIDLVRRNCTTQPKLPVLVIDEFGVAAQLSSGYSGFNGQVPGFHLFPTDSETGTASHGYDVTTTLAALFDANTPTGANPITECLDITGVQVAGIPSSDEALRIRNALQSLPTQRFIANYSRGFKALCPTEGSFAIVSPLQRAQDATEWIRATSNRWSNFLVTAAAGNCLNDRSAQVYAGHGQANYNSPIDISTGSDPLFNFMIDRTLWDATDANFPNVTASPSDQAVFVLTYLTTLRPLLPEGNVLVTGSARRGTTFDDLTASSFSNTGAEIVSVGENVLGFGGSVDGTSIAAPQIAGFASYLWLASNDLRTNRPVADTKAAITENTRSTGAGATIDAYATILSLDAPGPLTAANAPIRLGILDVNNDQKFDENDIAAFLPHFLDSNGNPIEPVSRDYSRFDLNGDGFTGGSRTESFDLDRTGSTQYGRPIYSSNVTQQIEGKTIAFDETQVTDMQVLCYYSYSPLYTGDAAARSRLVGGCAGVTVRVDPASVTLAPRATQQFVATVRGSNDPRVTWTVTGSGNSIDDSGLFRAGSAGGTFTVRATSRADSHAFGEATVTISGNTGSLFFGFDTDLEGWTPTPAVRTPCFNLATWHSGGFVVLDGADDFPSCASVNDAPDHQPNSWISKTIALPPGVTTLEFDVAGHNRPLSDSELRVRFVDSTFVSHTVLDWTTILGNQNPDPDQTPPPIQFSHRSLNISSFAGRTVTVFFEQGDNGPGNNEQVYLDNIWFH